MAEETVTLTTTAEERVESATTTTETSTENAPDGKETSTETPETPAETGSAPEQSKAVKELIQVRKRAQTAEAELAHYKALAAQTAVPEPVKDEPAKVLEMPKSSDFATWDEFEDAKAEYLIARAEERFAKKYTENLQKVNTDKTEETFQERIAEAAEKNPLITDILADKTMPISPAMAEIIKASDVAADMLVYLHDNRKEALRIRGLSPILAAKEMGRIEATLTSTPKPPPPKKVSQAPAPIKTVTGNGSPAVDENSLPIEDWIARRNATQFPSGKKTIRR